MRGLQVLGENSRGVVNLCSCVEKKVSLGKKSKLFVLRFSDSWGRNPFIQFSLGTFEEVGAILGSLEPSDETNIEK